MFGRLFLSAAQHVPIKVDGSAGQCLGGRIATKRNAGRHNTAWFAGHHSAILGGYSKPSSAEWTIPVDQATVKAAEGGVLLVACERLHGGLHRTHENPVPNETDFKVFFNNSEKDGSRLLDKPLGYTDYFYRMPDDDVKKLLELIGGDSIWPVPLCRTVYSWPINKDNLEIGKNQLVKIELAPEVLWDIDYVVLVIRKPKKELHPEVVKIIYLILGAALTAFGHFLVSATKK